MAQLSNYFGMGGTGWLEGYIGFFPISGAILQSGVFPLTLSPRNPNPIDRPSLFLGILRALNIALIGVVIIHLRPGWIDPPRLLGKSGRFVDDPSLSLLLTPSVSLR